MKIIVKNGNFPTQMPVVETQAMASTEAQFIFWSRRLASGNKVRFTCEGVVSVVYLRVSESEYTQLTCGEIYTLTKDYCYIQVYSSSAIGKDVTLKLEIWGDDVVYDEKTLTFQVTTHEEYIPVSDLTNGVRVASSTHTPSDGSYGLYFYDSSKTYLDSSIESNRAFPYMQKISIDGIAYLKTYGSTIPTYGPYTQTMVLWIPKE